MENFLTSNGLAAAFNLYGTVMMVALAVSLVVAVVLIMRFHVHLKNGSLV